MTLRKKANGHPPRWYMGEILESMGDIHFSEKKYDDAGRDYKRAMAANLVQANLRDQINALLAVSRLKTTIGQLDSGLFYSRMALLTAQKFGGAFRAKKFGYRRDFDINENRYLLSGISNTGSSTTDRSSW
jgi:hypothetical protein